eukprot:9099916-Pyramimonas_sp.AAC.1
MENLPGEVVEGESRGCSVELGSGRGRHAALKDLPSAFVDVARADGRKSYRARVGGVGGVGV